MLHQFLMGLNTESYGAIRSHILSMERLPSINKAYSLMIQEERQRSVLRDQETPKDHAIALAAGGKGSAPRYICDHCGKTGHSKSRCYELIGYPENWERNKDDSGRRNNNRRGQRPGGPNGGGSNKPTAPRGPGAAHSAQTNGAAAGGSAAGLHTLTDMEYRQLINLLGSVKMASSQPSDTQPLEATPNEGTTHSDDSSEMTGSPHQPAAASAPIAAAPAPSRRPERTRCPPARLDDYHCYSVMPTPSCCKPTPSTSSGMVYPNERFVNYNSFSSSHLAFLAALDSEDLDCLYDLFVSFA
ncbi:Unknown protein [Striga hermonthica]|uniref:CCHC-type domain-containing protein n=1 Tax=Striga hermonthica TaxID=68872 RepID=A0A9N7MPT3_STRHE|nr:Unknown protein [Striga hermonthica]